MARGRYSATPIIDRHHYATWELPTTPLGLRDRDFLANVKTVDYTFKRGDRLDQLAARFLGDDAYWWVIALGNNIPYALGIAPGTVVRIPVDVQDVLEKMLP